MATVLTVIAAAASPACGQVAPADLTEDFDTLVALLERTHPDPYSAFGGPDGFDRAAEAFRREARQLETVAELHGLAERFLARLGDGHTGMSTLPGGSATSEGWGPLVLGVATDGMLVQAAAVDYTRYTGARVLALNGVPLNAVLDSLRAVSPTENEYGAMRQLQRALLVKRADWPTVLKREEPLRMTVMIPAGDTTELAVPYTEDRPDFIAPDRALDLSGDNGLLYGKLLRHGDIPVGYFAWNAVLGREVAEAAYSQSPSTAGGTFDWLFGYLPGRSRTDDLEKDLDLAPSLYGRFEGLLEEMDSAGARVLILDLRRNSGGMTPLVYPLLFMLYGDAVIESDVTARYDTRVSRLFLSRRGYDDVEAYNERNGTDLEVGDIRSGYIFRNDLSLPREERLDVDRLTFSGYGAEHLESRDVDPGRPRVVVITSESTFSAAFHFAYYLAEIGDAVTVGVPPRQAPNAFMESTQFTLPRSGLRGTISNSVQRFYPEGDPRADVYTPDFAMTWEDYRRYDFAPDAEVLYALDLIASGRIDDG